MTSFQTRAVLIALLLAQASLAPAAEKSLDIPAMPQAAASALPGAEASGPQSLIPGALGSAEIAQPARGAAAAEASVEATAKDLAPELKAAAAPNGSDGDAAAAGQNAQTILQGGKVSDAPGAVLAAAGAMGSPSLMALAPAMQAQRKQTPPPSAPKASENGPRKVDSRLGYEARRLGLSLIAATYGVVASLPVAGPRLTAAVLKRLSYQDALLSDIDDTLVKFNGVLEPETVDAIVALRRSGKFFAAITDRPDKTRPGSSTLSAFDSLASIPASERAGIYVATNGGGKIYRYDAKGEPELIFEEKGLDEAQRAKVQKAAEAVKARLAGLGVELQSYNDNPYGMAMLFKAGTPEATVKQLAHIMEDAMRAEGLSYDVEGRLAKDPANPPYITFSKLDKSLAVRNIMKLAKLDSETTTPIGDSMYAPQMPKSPSSMAARAARWAERLSGRPIPLTGNATDRKMELAIEGALTVSVGTTGDPRMARAFVLDGKGPEVTRQVLRAMASRPKGSRPWTDIVPGLLIIAMLGLVIVGGMFEAGRQAREAEAALQQDIRQGIDQRPF